MRALNNDQNRSGAASGLCASKLVRSGRHVVLRTPHSESTREVAKRTTCYPQWRPNIVPMSGLLLALIVFAGVLFWDAAAANAQRALTVTDTTPVALAVRDKNEVVHFKIPRAYLTFSDDWKGGLRNSIAMDAIFPSMQPRDAAGTSTMDASDLVNIYLRSYANTGADYDVSKIVQWNIANEWTFVGNEGPFKKYVYRRDVDKWKDSNSLVRELLIIESQPDVYFDCLRQTGNPRVGCGVRTSYGVNLDLEFIFRRDRLHDWRNIRDGVVGLLDAFKVGAEK